MRPIDLKIRTMNVSVVIILLFSLICSADVLGQELIQEHEITEGVKERTVPYKNVDISSYTLFLIGFDNEEVRIALESSLQALAGVIAVKADLLNQKCTVIVEKGVDKQDLIDSAIELGLEVREPDGEQPSRIRTLRNLKR